MRPQKQLLRHKPQEGVYGDCHRAALASIFDMDVASLPHFGDGGPSETEFNARVDAWLATIGLQMVNIPFGACEVAHILKIQKAYMPGIYCLFGGTSKNDCGHTVVVKDGEIVLDPSLDESGIVGPMEDGFYWFTVFQPRDLGLYQTIWEGARKP